MEFSQAARVSLCLEIDNLLSHLAFQKYMVVTQGGNPKRPKETEDTWIMLKNLNIIFCLFTPAAKN